MKLMKSLSFWVLIAFILGSLLGIYNPDFAVSLDILGTTFIKVIKLFIQPIIFFTVALGIAQVGSFRSLGIISLKAFIYFELASTLALCIGWAVATIF